MFTRHTYTCPDVIYLRNRWKKSVIVQLVATVLFIVGLNVWGRALEKKEAEELAKAATPTE